MDFTGRLLLLAQGVLALTVAASAETQAKADDLRDLCSDRPGKATPACIVDTGHLQIETAMGDWTRDRTADQQQDSVLLGDSTLRFGLDSNTELQLGWMPFGTVRTRDRATGIVSHASGVGDVTLGLRHSLANPDGKGLSYAVQPFVSLPTGGQAIGAGTWGAGILVPLTVDLPGGLQLGLDPEVDAAPNQSRSGRHLAYSGVAALSAPVTSAVTTTVELWAQRDRDPEEHATQVSFDALLAWQPGSSKNLQLDAGTNIGLNHATPDVEIYAGITRRF